jgi:Tat protein translocase TatB subunit
MFGVGWVEIGIVAVVVFLFMKPEDLPKVMRKFGKLVRQIKNFSRAVNSDLQSMARDLERMDSDTGTSQTQAPKNSAETKEKHTEDT